MATGGRLIRLAVAAVLLSAGAATAQASPPHPPAPSPWAKAALQSPPGCYNVTITHGAPRIFGMAALPFAPGFFVATASGATLTDGELNALLASGKPVAINTGQRPGAEHGDIILASNALIDSGGRLALLAHGGIEITGHFMPRHGALRLTLQADGPLRHGAAICVASPHIPLNSNGGIIALVTRGGGDIDIQGSLDSEGGAIRLAALGGGSVSIDQPLRTGGGEVSITTVSQGRISVNAPILTFADHHSPARRDGRVVLRTANGDLNIGAAIDDGVENPSLGYGGAGTGVPQIGCGPIQIQSASGEISIDADISSCGGPASLAHLPSAGLGGGGISITSNTGAVTLGRGVALNTAGGAGAYSGGGGGAVLISAKTVCFLGAMKIVTCGGAAGNGQYGGSGGDVMIDGNLTGPYPRVHRAPGAVARILFPLPLGRRPRTPPAILAFGPGQAGPPATAFEAAPAGPPPGFGPPGMGGGFALPALPPQALAAMRQMPEPMQSMISPWAASPAAGDPVIDAAGAPAAATMTGSAWIQGYGVLGNAGGGAGGRIVPAPNGQPGMLRETVARGGCAGAEPGETMPARSGGLAGAVSLTAAGTRLVRDQTTQRQIRKLLGPPVARSLTVAGPRWTYNFISSPDVLAGLGAFMLWQSTPRLRRRMVAASSDPAAQRGELRRLSLPLVIQFNQAGMVRDYWFGLTTAQLPKGK